jgi:hypothetical protein
MGRSGLAVVREVQGALRALDLVFALASRTTPEEFSVPSQDPLAEAEEILRVAAWDRSAPIPNGNESESGWFSPFAVVRAGVFLLGCAAITLYGKRPRNPLPQGHPALRKPIADSEGNKGHPGYLL